MPGFVVGVVESRAGVGGAAEQEAGASADGFQGNDVPGVFGDDVGGDEVDFAGEVGDGASSRAAVGVGAVEAVHELGGALDLHAPERPGEMLMVEWGGADAADASKDWGGGGGRSADFDRSGTRLPAHGTRDGWGIRGVGCGILTRAAWVREQFAGIDDGVVAFAVAEGLGDAQAAAGGFVGEGEFGEFSAALGVDFALAWGDKEFFAGRASWDGDCVGRPLLDRVRARRWWAPARRGPGHCRENRKGASRRPRLIFLLYIIIISILTGESGKVCGFIYRLKCDG